MVTNQRASDEPNSLASGKAPPENTGPARVAWDTKQTQNLCFGCFEPLWGHWTSINVHPGLPVRKVAISGRGLSMTYYAWAHVTTILLPIVFQLTATTRPARAA